MRPVRTWLVLSALVFAVSSASAQQSIESGSLSGRVLDQTGASVPMAEITARQIDTNVSVTASSDAEGRFRLPYLRVGRYELMVRRDGFQDVSRALTVNAGAAFDLTFTLAVRGGDTQLTVSASAPVLDTARSQIAAAVSAPEIESLPMNGRNFLELALLAPGVTPANINSNQLFPETSAVPGPTLSVSSQRNLSNTFIVDGLSANDDAAALSGIAVSVDAIEQLQVVTAGGQAELGRALGGYVNVVTRSGTNTREHEAYYFGRDAALMARNPLTPVKLPLRHHHLGASAGGPVLANRTFYFGNVDYRRLDQSGLVTIAPEAVASINARLDSAGYAGPRLRTGLYQNPVRSSIALVKVTHAATASDHMSARYSLYDVEAENARGAGGLSAASASSGLENRDQNVAVTNTLVLTPRTVLESRGQITHASLQALPSDTIGPAVTIAGVASFGTLSSSPTARTNTMVEVVNALSYQTGGHAFRAGVDALHNRDRITFPRASRGSYTFSSLAGFLAGTYNALGFTQTFGATEVAQSNPNVGLYAQDEWHVRDGLTLNVGLRYDLQFLETIETDTNNVAPRIGVAWSPGGARQLVIRASGGLFFDRVPLRAVANALLSARNTTDLGQLRQVGVSLSPGQQNAPAFPDVLAAAVPSVTLPNLTTTDRSLQNAYSRQGAVEIERQLGARATVSAGYHYLRGVGLLMSINQNVPTCVAAGTNNGCRPNQEYANNNQYTAAGSSSYHGLHLSWVQHPASWGNYRVSYTLSRAMNDVGEFFFSSPIDPFDVSKDWGRSDDDQRQRLVISGAVRGAGFQVSGMLQAYSAPPLNITSGVTTIQGTAGRPIADGAFIVRNPGEGSPFISLNLRLTRTFSFGGRRSIEALVEGFNLTNHQNVLTRNGNFGTGAYPASPLPAFRQVTAVSEPRAVQLGMRVRF